MLRRIVPLKTANQERAGKAVSSNSTQVHNSICPQLGEGAQALHVPDAAASYTSKINTQTIKQTQVRTFTKLRDPIDRPVAAGAEEP